MKFINKQQSIYFRSKLPNNKIHHVELRSENHDHRGKLIFSQMLIYRSNLKHLTKIPNYEMCRGHGSSHLNPQLKLKFISPFKEKFKYCKIKCVLSVRGCKAHSIKYASKYRPNLGYGLNENFSS